MIRVLYGSTGQTIRHVTPAPVASASYEIVDLTRSQDDADRILASGAATVPSFTLTLDAAAGPNEADPRSIPVAATAGPAIGDTVFVVSASGRFESIELEAVTSGVSLAASSWLGSTYATGDTVTGAVITAAIPVALYGFEDALDDQRPLAILWTYDVGSAERVVTEQIRLTRTNAPSTRAAAAAARVRVAYPDLPARLVDGLHLDEFAGYCSDRIDADLALRAECPDRLLLGDPGVWLLHDRIIWELARNGYAPATRNLEDFIGDSRDAYSANLSSLMMGSGGSETQTLSTETTASHTPDSRVRGPIQLSP